MTLATALRTYVLADSAITAVISTRMHARKLPQESLLPAIVFQRIDTARAHDMDGSDGLPMPRMQLTMWADTPADAEALADKVRKRLDGVAGTWGSIEVASCRCVNDADIEDPELPRSGVIQDYMIQFVEV